MRLTIALLTAALALAAAPASDADSAGRCDSAWIGQSRTTLTRSRTIIEIDPNGSLRALAVLPAVYSGAQSYSGSGRVLRAPHGGWTAYLRGQRPTTLIVQRGHTRITVDRDVLMGSVAWSPSGARLAFAAVHRGARGRLASAAGGFRVRPLAATICSPFAWTRDSSRVAFVAATSNSCEPAPSTLTVADSTTGAIVSSAGPTAGVWSGPPVWSADGQFVSHDHLITPGIAIAPRISAGRRYSADDCTSARWAPVGHDLATICGGALTTIDARTGRRQTYAARVPHPLDAPHWSADARALATISDTSVDVTPLTGGPATVPFGGCISVGILGFDRATERAVIAASIAPPAD